jgi:hypothetical protein
MNLVLNNPYRIVGLLVGTTVREQVRQIRKLNQLIDAEQEPEEDFSFPALGKIIRTIDNLNDAASKLNLDSDKMSAALFWFYNGNPITDEPVFDAIKEADLDHVLSRWTKLTSNGDITQRNASAFSNLATLYLSGILDESKKILIGFNKLSKNDQELYFKNSINEIFSNSTISYPLQNERDVFKLVAILINYARVNAIDTVKDLIEKARAELGIKDDKLLNEWAEKAVSLSVKEMSPRNKETLDKLINQVKNGEKFNEKYPPTFDGLKDYFADTFGTMSPQFIDYINWENRNPYIGPMETLKYSFQEYLVYQGISLKLKFLESDFIKDLKALATDETFKVTNKELQLLFLNQVQAEIEKSGGMTSNKFLEILSKLTFLAKEDFLIGFIQKLIEQIEKKIEEAKTKCKANKANAVNIGETLQKETFENLSQIKSILSKSSIKYSSIADKVANEILQCSIDYFNDSKEKNSSEDYAETAIKLAKQAEAIVVGKLIKDRIKGTIETLEEMKNRELLQAIAVLQSIKDAYEKACRQIDKQVDELRYETIVEGFGERQPLKRPKFNVSINWSKVEEMKRKCLAWDKVTEVILEAIPSQNIERIKRASNTTKSNEYKSLVNFLMSIISNSYKNRIAYINYWETPKTNSSSSNSTSTNKPTATSSSSSGGGCYIATMAYGSYEHPQVLELQKFRDEILAKTLAGKIFIKAYYFISPKLVMLLKNQRSVNVLIRKSLNQFIKIIKK